MNDSFADNYSYPYTRQAKLIPSSSLSSERRDPSSQLLINTLEKSIDRDTNNRNFTFKSSELDPYLYGGIIQHKSIDQDRYDELDDYLARKIQGLKASPSLRKRATDDTEIRARLLEALGNDQKIPKKVEKSLPEIQIRTKAKPPSKVDIDKPTSYDDYGEDRPIKPMKGDYLSKLSSIPTSESNPSQTKKENPKYLTKSELAKAVSKPDQPPPKLNKEIKKPQELDLKIGKPVSPMRSKNNPQKRHLDLNSAYDPQNIPLISNQTRNQIFNTPRNATFSSPTQSKIVNQPQTQTIQYPGSAPVTTYPITYAQNQLMQQPQIIYLTDPNYTPMYHPQVQQQQQPYYVVSSDYDQQQPFIYPQQQQQPFLYPSQQPQIIYIQQDEQPQQEMLIPQNALLQQPTPREVTYEVVKRKSPVKTVYRHIYE